MSRTVTAGEVPLCSFSGLDSKGAPQCRLHRTKDSKANFCQGGPDPNNCARKDAFTKLDDHAYTQYEADQKFSQERVNSLVFNTFLFLQVPPSPSSAAQIAARRVRLLAGMDGNYTLHRHAEPTPCTTIKS